VQGLIRPTPYTYIHTYKEQINPFIQSQTLSLVTDNIIHSNNKNTDNYTIHKDELFTFMKYTYARIRIQNVKVQGTHAHSGIATFQPLFLHRLRWGGNSLSYAESTSDFCFIV
jgi:hypothetical protein